MVRLDHGSAVANQPLHRCGLVVFITRVDARAALEQQACGRDIAGEVQRRARVAAFASMSDGSASSMRAR